MNRLFPLLLCMTLSVSAFCAEVYRLLEYTHSEGGTTDTYTINYDRYAFPARVYRNGMLMADYQYIWHIPGVSWSQKTISSIGAAPYLETRTFHPDGRVASVRVGLEEKHYDTDGRHIKTVSYLPDNPDKVGKYQIYFAATNTWISGDESDDYQKTVVYLVGDDSYVTEYWYEGKVYMKDQLWYTDGDISGRMRVQYYMDGKAYFVEGSRTISSYDADGMKTVYIMSCDLADGHEQWQYNEKWIETPDYTFPVIKRGSNDGKRERYRMVDGQWELYSTEKYFWLNDLLVMTPKGCYVVLEDTIYVESILNSNAYYDFETGEYAYWDYSAQAYSMYYHMDKDGNDLERYMQIGNVYKKWDGNTWVNCASETFKVYYSLWRYTYITVDKLGRPVLYRMFNELNGFEQRQTMTYTDDSYTYYYYIPDDDDIYHLIYSVTNEDNGMAKISTKIYYKEDGTEESRYKSVDDYLDGVMYSYAFDYNESAWVLKYSYAHNIYDTDDSGVETIIERELDANGKPVNVNKTVSKYTPTYEFTEIYTWDTTRSKWVGVSKEECITCSIPELDIVYPTDPVEGLDEYFYPQVPVKTVAQTRRFVNEYVWDDAADLWQYKYGKPCSYALAGNTLSIYESGVETSYTIDADSRLVEEYHSDTRITNDYEYDDAGRLIMWAAKTADNSTVRTYTYGPVEMTDGVADVKADCETLVTVYNLQGIPVLYNATPDDVRNLAPGIYIAGGRKIYVR